MSEQIDWSKAPADAEYWCEMQFFKTVNGEWMVWCPGLGSWIDPAYKAPDNFSWWGNAVARPTTPSWFGEGLPPVGVVCEMQDDIGDWLTVEIIAVHAGYAHGWYGQSELCFYSNLPCEFRPIRTPEQIAADEREQALRAACDVVGCQVGSIYGVDVVKKLIDAGYRKP